ncbi:MAG: ATP-dependent DNA helicase PcrA [Acidobacteria bacterium]|nr:MAG: ATP-dependent DNA helicase PcrA [Acidobacteriota bacterium]PIE90971.1 MAG: ATP-dependent DNA helicase PcrA [Acidobacteriota bacterium]
MDYLENLNPEQRKAVVEIEGPLLVLAGAGSGKTKVITTRIVHLIAFHGVPDYRICAMTFTNKAAAEMKERVENMLGLPQHELTISTFHAFCARFLRKEIHMLGRERNFIIFDSQDQLKVVKDVLKKQNLNPKDFHPGAIKTWISNKKNKVEQGFFGKEGILKSIYAYYQQELLSQNALDFDDLIVLTNRILTENDSCRERYRDRFQHLLIDEYQDTNRVQFELIKNLTRESPNLCVVGDEDQSIYSWRGADIRNILDFEKQFKDARLIKLEQNYRSTQCILKFANRVIVRNTQRKPKNLWSKGRVGKPVSQRRFNRGMEEAASIARLIINSGKPYGEIAVLYRVNFLSRIIEETFRRKGIPYQLVGGLKFYDRKEIKDVLSYARCMVNTRDWTSFARAVNTPPRGIGSKSLEVLRDYYDREGNIHDAVTAALADKALKGKSFKGLREFDALLKEFRPLVMKLKPGEWMQQILAAMDYRLYLRKADAYTVEKREDNVNELMVSMREFEKKGVQNIADFLDQTALLSDQDQLDDSQDRVSLMTVHAAKGLEFDTVFLMGLEEGLFPNKRALEENPHGLEEERRLFYVAVTRAKNHLYISHSTRRSAFGSTFDNPPSRFLREQNTASTPSAGGYKNQLKASAVSGSNDSSLSFQVGEKVVHPVFGSGVILAASPKGLDMRITVRFPFYGTKIFLKSKASLSSGHAD